MDALDHGLHVLCEKPLALNYAQASEMAAKAEEQGAITFVPFTYRYMPSTRYLKHLIEEGYLGRPYHLHMRYSPRSPVSRGSICGGLIRRRVARARWPTSDRTFCM
jgi:predicted dehydrogenase